ncbi:MULTISPECIES: PD-(D/E)XK nuclease family protein [unclassified Saccharopolyspora]|uniref:RecB family exonuclease n=1 Tax=Saccharopolyspora TaxID=1835 RepID=UPI00190C4733|nr:PD-(D/E)XK nuclease family protein [Saccharopolyspora sp. HNM0986]MBK0870598.1 PD-(D/E)XK nuclease family protein [Saccharopolyspora sp. HNM0986]
MLRNVGHVQDQLGLEGIPSKLVRVTPAKLATWASCPRKFRMAYLDRPAPPRAGAKAASTLGAAVHNALRIFFDLPAQQRSPERAAALVRKCWKNDGFADAAQAADYRERAQHWVSGYAERTDAAPVAVERWVSAATGTIIAEGRVDRIDRRDGELVIVDYKTGRRQLTEADARDSPALALYATAARKTLRAPTGRVELHHLPTGSVAAWQHSEESLGRHVEWAQQRAGELDAASGAFEAGHRGADTFPPRPGRQCSWCDFRAHCPEGQQAASAATPWAGLAE